jgi:predicted anti-sigma-YlaC factor YlaD
MRCKKAKKYIHKYIDKELSIKKIKKLNLHLIECTSCKNEFDELYKTKNLLNEFKNSQHVHSILSPVLIKKIRNKNITIRAIKFSTALVILLAFMLIFTHHSNLSPVQKGLEYLASIQNEDGSFDSTVYPKSVAITSFSILAFLQHIDKPYAAKYKTNIIKGINFILNSYKNGLIVGDYEYSVAMYSHALATLVLTKLNEYNFIDRNIIKNAIHVILNSQNKNGGWRYLPIPYDDDLCVTSTQLVALSHVHDSSIIDAIHKGIKYIKKCSRKNGSFSYTPNTDIADLRKTIIAVSSLILNGMMFQNKVQNGLEFIRRQNFDFENDIFSYYSLFFYRQMLPYIIKDKVWQQHYEKLIKLLTKLQNKNGSWNSKLGSAYATSIALLMFK